MIYKMINEDFAQNLYILGLKEQTMKSMNTHKNEHGKIKAKIAK